MKNFPLLILAGLFILLCHNYNKAIAQELPGVRDSLYSKVLQEQRYIQVVLPRNYVAGTNEKFDVLYILDGNWQTKLGIQIKQYVEDQAFMPPTIIVGVMNTDRNRDFLPTKMEGYPTSGGADDFYAFLKEELIPHINKTYPSNGENILFGASFGGVFSMFAFLKDPNLFESYIASDPSFWWDENYMSKLTAEKLSVYHGLQKSIYVGGREGGSYDEMGIATMDSIFKANAPKSLQWNFFAYPNETHNSVNFKTMYDGLKFSYAGYFPRNIEFHPMNGTILKDKPYKVWCFSEPSGIHYTLNGNEPDGNSPTMEREITLSGPVEIKLKSFANRKRFDIVETGLFKEGEALIAEAMPENSVAGGFQYAYYEGSWDSLPEFRELDPVQTGSFNNEINIQSLPWQNNFACLIEGYLEIQEEGYYIFGLDSDDGSRLYLGDQLLIDHDGLQGRGNTKSYLLPLKKGFYPLRLEYFQKEGGRGLELVFLTPNAKEPKPIPLELQYGSK